MYQLTKHQAARCTRGCRGWLGGNEHMWVAAFICGFWNIKSTGGMYACTSSTSYTVPLSPPVICLAALP